MIMMKTKCLFLVIITIIFPVTMDGSSDITQIAHVTKATGVKNQQMDKQQTPKFVVTDTTVDSEIIPEI